MSIAEIHGKSPFGFLEDFLTADVFSVFRYLPADWGIAGYLRTVPGLGERIPTPNETTACTYYFWPLGQKHRREPDLLLELAIGDQLYHVVVEAKYQSGPSDRDLVEVERGDEIIKLGNQLADQLRDLRAGQYLVYDGYRRNKRLALSSKQKNRLLLYLTAHPLRPDEELARSTATYPQAAEKIYWSSWYHIYDYLQNLAWEELPFPYRRIIEDICILLDLKQFASFHGFADLPSIEANWVNGSFWKDHRIGVSVYSGITLPLDNVTGKIDASFWEAKSNGDLAFSGVRLPDFHLEDQASGSFWRMDR